MEIIVPVLPYSPSYCVNKAWSRARALYGNQNTDISFLALSLKPPITLIHDFPDLFLSLLTCKRGLNQIHLILFSSFLLI